MWEGFKNSQTLIELTYIDIYINYRYFRQLFYNEAVAELAYTSGRMHKTLIRKFCYVDGKCTLNFGRSVLNVFFFKSSPI